MYSDATLKLNIVLFPLVAITAVLVRLVCKNVGAKFKLVPFAVATAVLLLAELGKQVYELAHGTYNLFSLPFHICTIVIVGFGIVSFKNPSKPFVKVFWNLTLSAGLLVTVALLLAPNPIIGGASFKMLNGTANYVECYSVFAHYALVLLFFMGLSLNVYTPTLKDLYKSSLIWICSLVVILVAANVLQQNYANFLEFKLPFLKVEVLGLPLFQTILFVAYVAVYLLGALGLYNLNKFKSKLLEIKTVDYQVWS